MCEITITKPMTCRWEWYVLFLALLSLPPLTHVLTIPPLITSVFSMGMHAATHLVSGPTWCQLTPAGRTHSTRMSYRRWWGAYY